MAPPGPVDQVGRLSETVIAFAGVGRALTDTVVAFAGEKWVFLVQFSGAEVMVVSMVAVQGRTVVLSVSTSPSCRASCAKKFALHAQNTRKLAFLRLLGELFRGNAAEGAVRGEFFSRQSALRPGLVGDVAHEAGCGGGFAALEAGWRRVAGVSYL